MKLCDLCIVFAILFLCMMIPLDFYVRYLGKAVCLTEEYNRTIDRAAEDALMNTVERELEDGTVVIKEEQVKEQFYHQMLLCFQVDSQEGMERLMKGNCMQQIVQREEELETDVIQMEQQMNSGETDLQYELYPVQQPQEGSRPLEAGSFYTFFKVKDFIGEETGFFSFGNYHRFVFSGSHLQKVY